jgi:hypothetical protein
MLTTAEVQFPKFREDPDQYQQSQTKWSEVFNDALKPIDPAGWDVWLNDPFHEGTPIFSRVHRAMKIGVVINQILPSDDELSFRAYLDIFAPDSNEDLVEHVVIMATLTKASKTKAAKVLRHYLQGHRPKQEIVTICEELTG